ncbi:retrovirus-related pol polyprotein from transposon TNT 1-94 [Tanacetum coccineum]
MIESPFGDSGFAVPVFSPGDDPIACLNKAMAFLTAIASSRFPTTNNQLGTSSNPRNQATIQDGREKSMLAEAQEARQILDEEQLAFLADLGIPTDQVPNSETYLNDMDNQSVHALQDFEQTPVMDFTDNEISSDSNIIPYSQYLQETQQATVQDTNLQERVKTFEQRLNIDLSSREKMIDSQMDDTIREKLALKEHIDSLKQNLSKQIKEKESLFKTFTVFKNEIDLEKKIKELDNIICKVGQSAQTVHMLTKPQAFYDNTHKQALGYQNLFYLKKAQRLKPTLYDGVVLSNTHVAIPVIDDEETLILEEESRSKMSQKAKVPESLVDKQCLDVLLTMINSMSWNNDSVNVEMQMCDSCEKCLNLDAELFKSKQAYNDLLKNYSQLEKHCISLEVSMQLKQEVFQNDDSCVNQNAVEIKEYFEINDLKDRLQDKDKTICKLKATIKSLRENTKEENVFKDQFDSIKQTRVCHKEQSDSLINKLNLKSVENKENKVFVITSLKNDLQKLKGKEIVENVVHIPSATTIAPGMFKLDLESLPPRLLQNREVHIDYIRNTQEQANILQEIVEQAKAKQPLDSELGFACTVRFGNDQIARIMGYGDYHLRNVIISRVYYIEGLGHNLFSVGQFCDADLEVVFRKNTCFIQNFEGVDLLSGSRDTILYTISLDDLLKSSPICLLSKASKTKRWLWNHRLSHLNFSTLNKLAKYGLARGISRLKFQKYHLCLACALGKSKKSSHQPKAEDNNQEKLYLLHMDLCDPMHVAIINGKSLLCYPTNDNEDLGKFDAKADIWIFVGYVPVKKAFKIYNRRTQIITETIHVMFDELTIMASEQFSSGPGL